MDLVCYLQLRTVIGHPCYQYKLSGPWTARSTKSLQLYK